MKLYDEKKRKEQEKKNVKMKKTILISIVVLVVLIIAIICVILYLMYDPNKITLKIDGKENAKILELLDIEKDEKGEMIIYAPIKQIAEYLGYKAYNGEYQVASEDINKCYIVNDYEVVEFEKDSKTIYKLNLEANNTEYEECELKNKVSMNQGNEQLYIDDQGLQEVFNISIGYNKETRTINIYELDTIVNSYTKHMDTKVYEKVDESFNNKKAVLDNFLIVDGLNKKKGVLKIANGKATELLEAKYDDIKYIAYDSSFLITNNGKVGIIDSKGDTKVSPSYETLTLIDKKNNLYLAGQNKLYGVIDGNGNIIIHIEYNKIGIDIKQFSDSGIKTGYILMDKLIPVMLENKWGFYDVKGSKISELKYTQIGCTGNSSSNVYNLLDIPEYRVLVVGKDKKFTLINDKGEEQFNTIIDKMYIKVTNGEKSYNMEFNNTVHDIIEFLNKKGLKPVNE